MNLQDLRRWLALIVLSLGLAAGNSMAQLGSLFQQLGGMDMVGKLASNFLQSSASDPRLAGLPGKVNPSGVEPEAGGPDVLDARRGLQGSVYR
jgi:hypothetical protein